MCQDYPFHRILIATNTILLVVPDKAWDVVTSSFSTGPLRLEVGKQGVVVALCDTTLPHNLTFKQIGCIEAEGLYGTLLWLPARLLELKGLPFGPNLLPNSIDISVKWLPRSIK